MTSVFGTQHPFLTEHDISSTAFWGRPFDERDRTFARLRVGAPVSWHPPIEDPTLPPEVHGELGFWAVTRAEDIRYASVNPGMFSSALGGVGLRPRNPALAQAPSFLEMDPPEHSQYRRVMSSAFTPKAVARLVAEIEARATQIVDAVVGVGEFDFVSQVSAKLPMLTVADMIGVPRSLVQSFADAGDNFVATMGGDPRVPEGVNPLEFLLEQLAIIRQIGVDLVRHRREHPADDIATALAKADFGQPLSDDEIQSIMVVLCVAGNDTTKQTTSWTVLNLDHSPDQRAWLMADFDHRIDASIEEFVRCASPVIQFARTAKHDVELGGAAIAAGDKVGLFYCSGNRDETLFSRPERFDLTRPRVPHIGFGGGGLHYCLGATIARAQLKALFSEILTKLPRLEITGEPKFMQSEFINGIVELPAHSG